VQQTCLETPLSDATGFTPTAVIPASTTNSKVPNSGQYIKVGGTHGIPVCWRQLLGLVIYELYTIQDVAHDLEYFWQATQHRVNLLCSPLADRYL
jgi:hypothetical protein